jgi:hypothetical protein
MARQAELNDVRTGVLLAGQVHGSVTTLLDTRQVAIAGLFAGLGIGVMFLVRSLTRRR